MKRRLNNNCFLILSFIIRNLYFHYAESTATDEQLANISLRLYLGNSADDGNYIDELVENAFRLLYKFDLSKPTVIYIHGFTENLSKESVQTVVNAYLKRKDHNVVAVNWAEIASENYILVAASIERVGKTLAKALNSMMRHSLNWSVDKLHIVGHSLGGQISGFIGRNVDFKLRRITALDPAGPGFVLLIKSLNSKDAKFVDVIHTDAGIYGNIKPSGTADFYPNGGFRIQPGCPILFIPLSDEDYCSHFRSWQFYAESVVNETAFIGVECNSNLEFHFNKCKNNKNVVMGFATPFGTKGFYYLKTNDKKPFGRGINGVNPKSKFS